MSEKQMDPEIQQRVEKTVRKILKKANLYEMTEKKVRQQASEKLGIDLDLPDSPYKLVVRRVVESFLQQEKAKATLAEEEANPGAKQSVKQEHEARGISNDLIGGTWFQWLSSIAFIQTPWNRSLEYA